jgi:hypothetical protein
MMQPMRDPDDLFAALQRSDFRRRFRLNAKDTVYLRDRGIDAVIDHAHTFITERLAPAHPRNDGRQTPMRGHPAFVAQHATATCCRSCLAKWHGIDPGAALDESQIDYIVGIIRRWLEEQVVE